MKKFDLAGQRFGRLVVIENTGSVCQRIVWLCQCDCGLTTHVPTAWLRNGNTRSCGCLGREARSAAASAANTTHGMTRTPTYESWFNMRRRCQETSHKSFKNYGARGISVCEHWAKFENFLADMGDAPAGMSIERVNVDGNYEPGNCKWATSQEQSRNRRNNRHISAFGVTKLLIEWSEDERCAVSLSALEKRLAAGWDPEKALTVPKYGTRGLGRGQ